MAESQTAAEKFGKLLDVMKRLRSPGGCPWDREQDYLSLRRYIIEESYELVEAIENEDICNMREECGDLLLQVVFVACIAEERGDFDMAAVIEYLVEKLIRRHPHVFGDVDVKNSEDVLKNWEQIKIREREGRSDDSSLMAGIPRGVPSLLRAYRMQERAAKVGFDWPDGDAAAVIDKVDEEIAELKEAISNGCPFEDVEEELGDLMFAIVNLSRHLRADPETAMHKACGKFASRFRHIEEMVAKSGRQWKDFGLDELDMFWNEAKTRGQETRRAFQAGGN